MCSIKNVHSHTHKNYKFYGRSILQLVTSKTTLAIYLIDDDNDDVTQKMV